MEGDSEVIEVGKNNTLEGREKVGERCLLLPDILVSWLEEPTELQVFQGFVGDVSGG